MTNPRRPLGDIVDNEFTAEIKFHLESILELEKKIQEHEQSFDIGDWFNLAEFCNSYGRDSLGELYGKVSKMRKLE